MRISVDPDRCQGHAQCLSAAPELFGFDDEAEHALPLQEKVPAGQEPVARRAAAACPERAITLTD
ncbi:ferredoxin [Actinocorallia sp. B10E7]|uniref:ferredoxin n=1 Tax=Actinocorallia sp. B10E7 TaxID=3153558 RepID=UPI00325C3E87